jgi:hypothetical protein
MGRLRRTSKAIEQARARANGLKSKHPDFDLGNGLTAAAYDQEIDATQAKLDAYNQALAIIDDLSNELTTAERSLSKFSTRIFAAVKAKHGSDSSEYELVGGTRDSERQPRKTKPAKPKA